MSDIEKLKYLNSKLTGEAKQAVSGILLSNENYRVAIDLLKERFGDKQTVINSHYSELIKLTPASNNTKSMRSLYDQMGKNLWSLDALNQDTNQDMFVSIVTSKIPKEILIQLEIQKGSKEKWSVAKLRELLNEHISARERERAENQAVNESKQLVQRSSRLTTEALISGYRMEDSINSKKTVPPCFYCGDRHWNDECQTYRTLDARKQKFRGCCLYALRKVTKPLSAHCQEPATIVNRQTFIVEVYARKSLGLCSRCLLI